MAYPKNRKSSSRAGCNKGVQKPRIDRTCQKCGEVYSGFNGTRYCSDRCALLANVEVTDGCWLWTGYAPAGGSRALYGEFDFKSGKRMLAHRAAYLLLKGEDPGRMCVCHTCDNPRCVRPDHLWLGTRAQNNADRDAKGRHASQRMKATAHG